MGFIINEIRLPVDEVSFSSLEVRSLTLPVKLITNEVKLPEYEVKLRILSVKNTAFDGKFPCLNVNITNIVVNLSDTETDITIREVKPAKNAVNIQLRQ